MLQKYKIGNHLSYMEYGDRAGYPILVQHGLIASIDDHDLFDRLIHEGVRVICIARPGYGDSSPYLMESLAEWADIVSSLVQTLDLHQFDILGISSGAPYSYSLSACLGGKVRNIYILSGIPALYDEIVLSQWPYPILAGGDMSNLEGLAQELFFSHLSDRDRARNDIKDSMRNNCFGVAQDLRLRFIDWGFRLSEVKGKVFMRHSRCDSEIPFTTAVRTAELLPHCTLELADNGPHFSREVLDDFIGTTIARNL
jgi:pimeloyl-ACP methyl ester carboxylesterase